MSYTIVHATSGLGIVPRDLGREGRSGVVGAAMGIGMVQVSLGAEVRLLGWNPNPGPAAYSLGNLKVWITKGWKWPGMGNHAQIMLLPLLLHSLRNSRPDILHAHVDPRLLLLPARRIHVLHLQTPTPHKPPFLYRWLVRRADAVICCSRFIREQFLNRVQYAPERTFVVHNGVDPSKFQAINSRSVRRRLGIAPDQIVILFAGAVVPEKGLLHLLRAIHASSLRQRVHIVVAGAARLWATPDNPQPSEEDGYYASLQQASKKLSITWLGIVPTDQMPVIYSMADIFVCPSVWEDPFPHVNVEAMAAGKPVVASRVGGTPEVVEDGVNGLLVPPGDESVLAMALDRLVCDPDLRRRLGEAGRQRAEGLTWERIENKVRSIYESTMGRYDRMMQS